MYVNLGRMNVLYHAGRARVNVNVIQGQIFTFYFYGSDFKIRMALIKHIKNYAKFSPLNIIIR